MEDPSSKERVISANAVQARLLTDDRALRCLAPLLCGEHTLSSAAAAGDVPPSTMAYWLPRFLDAGLIEVASRRKRAGMTSTCYRPAADVFLIEAGLLDQARIDALLDSAGALRESVAAMRTAGLLRTAGLAVRGRSPTTVQVTFNTPPGTPTRVMVRQYIETMRLSREQAEELWADLVTLLKRYQAAGGKGSDYVLQVAISPADPNRAG